MRIRFGWEDRRGGMRRRRGIKRMGNNGQWVKRQARLLS